MNLHIGRWVIEPLYVMWFVMVLFCVAALAASSMDADAKAASAGFLVSLIASVPVHESGHVAIAERRGFTIDRVLVGRFSGVTWSAEGRHPTVNDVLVISAAGPLMNLAFAGAFALLTVVVEGGDAAFWGAAAAMGVASLLDLIPSASADRMSDGALIKDAWRQRQASREFSPPGRDRRGGRGRTRRRRGRPG